MQASNTIKTPDQSLPTIAIVYLLYYHNESYIDDMVQALTLVDYPKDKLALVIVSNPHAEHGHFLHYIEDTVLPQSTKQLPRVVVLPQEQNIGFAEGNNAGSDWAIAHGYDYVFFHNNDGFIDRGSLRPIAMHMEAHPHVGAAQMLMLLYPDTAYINSTGNMFHYLGFGYSGNYRKKLADVPLHDIEDIAYASGAALFVRASAIAKLGAWETGFFMYHEDVEWSLRLRIAGYDVHMVRDSIFFHKYQFSRSITNFFWMERNRYGVLLMFYRWPTLVLLAPMLLVMEIGQIFFAFKRGWFHERIKLYRYWIKKESWSMWLKKRTNIQSIRTRPDRYLLKYTVPTIRFQEKFMEHWLLSYVANPIMTVYYWGIRCIVRW
jgi:GT2 family glycosyltransferase